MRYPGHRVILAACPTFETLRSSAASLGHRFLQAELGRVDDGVQTDRMDARTNEKKRRSAKRARDGTARERKRSVGCRRREGHERRGQVRQGGARTRARGKRTRGQERRRERQGMTVKGAWTTGKGWRRPVGREIGERGAQDRSSEKPGQRRRRHGGAEAQGRRGAGAQGRSREVKERHRQEAGRR